MNNFIRGMRDRNVQTTRNLDDGLDDEFGDLPRPQSAEAYAPPRPVALPEEPKLPDYVKHADGADAMTKLTSHAVINQYEAAARTVEAMREPIRAWADAHEKALDDLRGAMERIDETAKHFRDLGAATFDRLQQSAAAITEVRRTCDEVTAKIDPASSTE